MLTKVGQWRLKKYEMGGEGDAVGEEEFVSKRGSFILWQKVDMERGNEDREKREASCGMRKFGI